MNSEELEQSLRSEFESYLKTAAAEKRGEMDEFRARIETEFNEQKARFDQMFGEYSARYDAEPSFDDAFRGSVAEHLRLARDEGARITADAMAEAERLQPQPVASVPVYDQIKDAVDDIASKDSQSAILKSLVGHAGKFAPRGAFFIVKSEHFGGWKTFDANGETADAAIRDIHLPIAGNLILGAAAQGLRAVTGAGEATFDNSSFLEPLGFGESQKAYAVPLVARGRTVAVLYADHGTENGEVNLDALETLVRVAGLTVELLAFSHTAPLETTEAEPVESETRFEDTFRDAPQYSEPATAAPTFGYDDSTPSYDTNRFEQPEVSGDPVAPPQFGDYGRETAEPSFGDYTPSVVDETPAHAQESSPFDATPAGGESFYDVPQQQSEPQFEAPAAESKETDFVFDSGGSIEHAAPEATPFEPGAETRESAPAFSGSGYGQAFETPVAPPPSVETAPPVPSRRADRPVDLPIEVPDDERRIHNDARRFARLLVSEIKLYNEKKVTEGRDAQDLYDRLREAIDRSREMYDKRVQAPVAAKFDYFHYELVNSLADGDANRLGTGYPGSAV